MTTFVGTGPTAFAQRRPYPMREVEEHDDSFLVIMAMRLDGGLDAGALHRTVREGTARHMVCDGRSLGLVFRDIDAVLPGAVAGATAR